MATTEILQVEDRRVPVRDPGPGRPGASLAARLLAPLASLKLTVVLFLAAILIVLFGTLAQVYEDIWQVMRTYFRVDFQRLLTSTFPWFHPGELFVWVEPKLFFPPAFFPKDPVFPAGLGWMSTFWPQGVPSFPAWFGIWFPKGWTVGAALLVNLLAAHLVRFKVQARGTRLAAGTGILVLGTLLTYAVIASGSNGEGLQAKPLISYALLWRILQACLFGLFAVAVYATAATPTGHRQQRWSLGILSGILALSCLAFFQVDPAGESTLRILYQVLKATLACVVLLAGCLLVFKKRAGIVLLHAGIGLMMLFDVLVGVRHVESQMQLIEGESTNYSRDMREVELAIVQHDGKNDTVTAIDQGLLSRAGKTLDDPRLPFRVEVLKYLPNAMPRSPKSFKAEETVPENPANSGIGQQMVVVEMESAKGTDNDATFDIPAAYLKLTAPDGNDLGTWLVSPYFDFMGDGQQVTVGGKTYDLALRFRRHYNDYTITLNDVQKNDYAGTDRPRDYSSFITLNDPQNGTTFEHRIWMNNPMRYAGKTYYQQNYSKLQEGESSTLQVVDNYGWMTPYVACMMVVIGMLYHFSEALVVYLNRRLREQDTDSLETDPSDETTVEHLRRRQSRLNKAGWIFTAAVCGLVLLMFVGKGLPRAPKADQFDLTGFGALPMWYKGRAMPIDTFARNALMQLSDRQTFKDEGDTRSQPAIRLLLDILGHQDTARDHRIIRIESADVRDAVGLAPREGLTYSVNDLHEHLDKIIEEASAAAKVPAKDRTLFQRKMVELANRIIFFSFLDQTFGTAPTLPVEQADENETDIQRMTLRADQYLRFIAAARGALGEFSEQYGLGPLPLVVPTHLETGKRPDIEALNTKWEPVTIAHIYDHFYSEFPAPTPPALERFMAIVNAYAEGNVTQFNSALDAYQKFLSGQPESADLPLSKVRFESWYERMGAYNLCSWLYVVAFVLAVAGWLGWPQVFGRAAFWLTVLLFAIHTLAMIGRIYISGRPPVTNLYSSAIFIGWAVVAGGLIIETLSHLGLGTVVAAMAGFLTLRIAHALAADGDTFVVLEAVLDTQFWLATHVVCVTLGYATTYMAGLIGLLYILIGVLTPSLNSRLSRELSRMMYGTICFALFFSFWGTVLGGLWADDSWGRFWGWDPKENGALIIVLWNALALHARWAKLVRERGLAVLTVLGNIVVSWSWFGVNELGVGLHSYGFTEGRLLMLALFMMSQLVLAGMGCLPRKWWRSHPVLSA